MKKATLVAAGQPLLVNSTIEIISPPPKGVIVKTLFVGICRTDVYLADDRINLGNGQTAQMSQSFESGLAYEGTIPGHEVSGVIEAFGEDADATKYNLAIGDKVLVYPWFGCMKCSMCKVGENNMCPNIHPITGNMGLGGHPGGYATYVPVPSLEFIVKVPSNLPMDLACMIPCSGTSAYDAVLKTKSSMDFALRSRGEARLLVVGVGGLGVWGVALSKLEFAGSKVYIDAMARNPEKEDLIKKAGADNFIVVPDAKSEQEKVAIITHSGTVKYDAIIDFVGDQSTVNAALHCVSRNATYICVGIMGGILSIPVISLVPGSLTIRGSITSSLPHVRKLVEILAAAEFTYPSVEHFSLDDINIALDKLRKGQIRGRAVLNLSDEAAT